MPPLNPSPAITGGTFAYDDLAAATDGFSDANLLGQGGFGHVCRGTVGGQEVAIKKLRAGSGQGDREFRAEVEIISRVHHKNLVSLVGYCLYGEQRLLVYEYVPTRPSSSSSTVRTLSPNASPSPECRATDGCIQTFFLLRLGLTDFGARSQGVAGRHWTGPGGGRSRSARQRASLICTKTVSSWPRNF